MNLAKQSIFSASYNFASSGVQAIFQFLRSILLARLLLPDQYGIYTFTLSVILLTHVLPGFGMGHALIHRAPESDGEIARQVHFTISFVFNLLWVLILVAFSLLFLDIEHYLLFCVVIIAKLIENLTVTARIKLIRLVSFRRIAIIESTNTVTGSVIAVFLAWKGAGAWSLVSTNVTTAIIYFIGFYIILPVWKPRFGWSSEVASYLINFGRRSFVAGLLHRLIEQLDDLWIGTYLGNSPLGFYSRAYTFSTYPRRLLAKPINQVASATYAALKEKPKRLSQAFFRVNAFLIRAGFLFSGLFFLLIPEFIHFVIGDKWEPILVPFRIMLFYTLLDPIKITIGNVFTAIGKPEEVVKARFWQLIILIIGLLTLGRWMGINGVAISVDIMLIFGIVMLLWKVRPYVQFSVRVLFAAPILAISVGLSLAMSINHWINPVPLSFVSLFQKTLMFLIAYIGVMLLFERGQIRYWIQTGKDIIFGKSLN